VHFSPYTPAIFVARPRHHCGSRACPCEGVFSAQVRALQRIHVSTHVVRQRQHRNSRACPCERVFNAQVCARQRIHTSTFGVKDSAMTAGLSPASVSSIRCVTFNRRIGLTTAPRAQSSPPKEQQWLPRQLTPERHPVEHSWRRHLTWRSLQ
jgi:hypothetical protein